MYYISRIVPIVPLESRMVRLEQDFDKKLKVLTTALINQDIEKANHDVEIKSQAWGDAFLLAKEISSMNYELVINFFASVLMYIEIFLLLCAALAYIREGENQEYLTNAFLMPFWFLFFPFAIIGMLCYNAKVRNDTLELFGSHRSILVEILQNDYTLQKPHMLSLPPFIEALFKRNQQISMGYLISAHQEKQRIKNRLFLLKFNPKCNPIHLNEVYRLISAFEHFHSGCPVSALSHLIQSFTIPYFQSIADQTVSQILLILWPKLMSCTPIHKKYFLQLMLSGSEKEPDSAVFYFASFNLQSPDSEDIPLDYMAENHVTRHENVLAHSAIRQMMMQHAIKICTPLTAVVQPTIPRKNLFFSNQFSLFRWAPIWINSSKKLKVDDDQQTLGF